MAEIMEETDRTADVDLEVDGSGFRRAQFAAFKHDFLESFDESGYAKLEHLTLDKNLKKEVVNMARRLQKARISLNSLPDSAVIEPVISKMDETFEQLIALSKESSEFSVRNIKLPEYNKADVEALLGKIGQEKSTNRPQQQKEEVEKWGNEHSDNAITAPNSSGCSSSVAEQRCHQTEQLEEKGGPIEWLCRSNEQYEKRIEALLGAGELLLNEWHEIKQYMQRNMAMNESPK